ncbi:2'-5' RNA ligase family protein [Caenispirillum bisanense]|uniref:2'-5' RNA ligase superfamily protein n=1 Tax=Caenispirillum bisanense TaxID=414052 RepID=A0A286G5D8_9PROT|nr:2'-5' RNA ligase family protein [Caenispirillum bisanense]SOD90359.1 2'-5' RNA ligase superfamily protein [Caenispirillum bisanense]
MTRLAVVALPRWHDHAHGAAVEALRRRHDPLASYVPAHVTLVFPVAVDDESEVTGAAEATAGATAPIDLRFTAIVPFADPLSGDTYAFLEPEDGAAVSALHARLHAGSLARFRRPDIPYRPHVTVGRVAGGAPLPADALAGPCPCPATLDRLTVLRLADAAAVPIASHPLTGT